MARTREQLELIWQTTLRDVQRFKMPDGSGSIGTINSERWTTVQEELEDLAAMLVDELDEDEQDDLTTVTEGLWEDIRDRLIEWAVSIGQERDARRAKVAV